MTKTIPISGFVADIKSPTGKLRVDGHAFEIEGFEFMHLWVTPMLFPGGMSENLFTVSQWESGYRLPVFGHSIDEAIAAARDFVQAKGVNECREKVAPWQIAPVFGTAKVVQR